MTSPTVAADLAAQMETHRVERTALLELRDGRIAGITFFLDTARFFPTSGMPARLDPEADADG